MASDFIKYTYSIDSFLLCSIFKLATPQSEEEQRERNNSKKLVVISFYATNMFFTNDCINVLAGQKKKKRSPIQKQNRVRNNKSRGKRELNAKKNELKKRITHINTHPYTSTHS